MTSDTERPEGTARFLSVRFGATGLAAAVGCVAATATLAGFGERWWWVFDLFSHFRLQYIAMLAVSALVLVTCRRKRAAAFLAAFLIMNVIIVAIPFTGRRSSPEANARLVTLAYINVNTANRRVDLVLEYITRHSPDVVVLEEVSDRWVESMKALEDTYPHVIASTHNYDNFGIALMSRHAFVKSEIVFMAEYDIPSAHVQIDIDGRPLSIIGTHATPPGGAETWRLRNLQLDYVAGIARACKTPLVLAGDLNAASWSHVVRKFGRDSALVDASRGLGPAFTWPTFFAPLRIPIDHCFHSQDMAVVSRYVGPSIGSDHFPVLVTLALP